MEKRQSILPTPRPQMASTSKTSLMPVPNVQLPNKTFQLPSEFLESCEPRLLCPQTSTPYTPNPIRPIEISETPIPRLFTSDTEPPPYPDPRTSALRDNELTIDPINTSEESEKRMNIPKLREIIMTEQPDSESDESEKLTEEPRNTLTPTELNASKNAFMNALYRLKDKIPDGDWTEQSDEESNVTQVHSENEITIRGHVPKKKLKIHMEKHEKRCSEF